MGAWGRAECFTMAGAIAGNGHMTEEHNSTQTGRVEDRSPQFEAATQPSYAHTLFFDAGGLRPGWGFAGYVIAFYLLQRVTVEWAWIYDLGAHGLWSGLLEELGNFVAAVVPALVLTRIEKRPWKVYGLPISSVFGRNFWFGSAWGFVAVSVLMLSLCGLHVFAFGHLVLHGIRLARFAAYWAAMFLLVGL